METTHTPSRAVLWLMVFIAGILCSPTLSWSQEPTVSVRLANPDYNCTENRYCLDVEFSSDTPGQELYGMNVRFFYDPAVLSFDRFQGFRPGYAAVSPDPPMIITGAVGVGYQLFGFGQPGVTQATFVNGAIQLLSIVQNDILLPTEGWVDIFQICFYLTEPLEPNATGFCPSIVWDLQQDPANGGYLGGDEGVTITVVSSNPMVISEPVIEQVVHYNWVYIGTGDEPFGEPIQQTCDLGSQVMACLDHINVSIADVCGTQILSGIILTGDQAGNNTYAVYIIDSNGDTVPNAILTWEHIGKTFKIKVVNVCNGQSCWGWMTVEDKRPPDINCVCPAGGTDENCTITCLQVDQFLAGDIPGEFYPVVTDSCDGTTLDIVDIVLEHSVCDNGFLRVTWQATDNSGNKATCVQHFDIIPLTTGMVSIPDDITGDCTTLTDPSVTGWPTIDGIPYNSETSAGCNLGITYTDQTVQLCGAGKKIIRRWRIIDWCSSSSDDFFQTINLADTQGPELTCSPDITVSTGIWACYADVVLPLPGAIDICSGVESYQVVTTAGLINVTGNSVLLPGLAIGDHLVTWTVKDKCHNTSTCSFVITVEDQVPPVVSCHLHTVVSLVGDRPEGITLVAAESFSDGSTDNCGPVTIRARRMGGCIDFDWTTAGACIDDLPGGIPPVNERDHGTAFGPCVPFSCCDIGNGPVMVEVEVSDQAGNVNYCMVEVIVQDKLSPVLTCPPEIRISCDFILNLQPGTYTDINENGALDEDPLSAVFGNVFDASKHSLSDRQPVIIHDTGNPEQIQPYTWGIDGWATDNCPLALSVTVAVFDDCSGSGLPGNPPAGAVRLIERRFLGNDGVQSGSCLQRIWVIDYERFYISDTTCGNEDPDDGVIWPCDIMVTSCPEDLSGTGAPVIFDDGCSLIGVTYEDARFEISDGDGACFKILRAWKLIDWCQFNGLTGTGFWSYTQTIKVIDSDGVQFPDMPSGQITYCLDDPGITLPANNQIYLGEHNPGASSCSVHVSLGLRVRDLCSNAVTYEVRVYPFDGAEYIQVRPSTVLALNASHEGVMSFSTLQSAIPAIAAEGLPYNSSDCGDYHRIVWAVTDGCGNHSEAEYLFRLEDCKAPVPVCHHGLSTVVMPSAGEVTIWASDFNASSYDDCTSGESLVFSFSGVSYQPSFTYTCDNVPVFGEPVPVQIWVGDEGSDLNCNGVIEWSERNSEFCVTYIVITDNTGACNAGKGGVGGVVVTEQADAVSQVTIHLTSQEIQDTYMVTAQDGAFQFDHLPLGAHYTVRPVRDDDPRNGVNTLDLVRIQRHLLGIEPFTSAYQYIAADANNSHSVSVVDVVDIRRVILGLQHTFTQNTSWRFAGKSSEVVPGNPWPFSEEIEIFSLEATNGSDMDFVGVKVGDVNNTVIANAVKLQPRQAGRTIRVKTTTKGRMIAGEEIEIGFSFPEKINGFQWTMELQGLEYTGISSDVIAIDDQNTGLPEDGVVTMSWHDTRFDPAEHEGPISLTVRFRVTEPGNLIHMLRLTDRITASEAYTPGDEVLGINLVYQSTDAFTDFVLYQNKPNPWNHQTVIGFHLPEDGPVLLTVYDGNGMIVKSLDGAYGAGYNTITLSEADIPDSGMLFYRLESGSYSATKKMIRIR